MKLAPLAVLIVVVSACSLLAGSAARAVPADLSRVFDPPRAPGDARLEKAVNLDSYHPWTPITDLEVWKKRRDEVRRQVLVAAGLWPLPPKTPLEPVIHGRIERDEYTIEKVYFQSYPGFYVTGNLYRPKSGPPRKPAVLSPHGHWANGRFYERPERERRAQIDGGDEKTLEGATYPLQARCAQLARLGCVVFHYDMVGYADTKQIGHAAGFGDVEAELRLQSAFGLQSWNTVRAYDFLESLPDVDPRRVGVTGASGGGTQTFILAAIDDRPAALFPAVMVSTAMQGGCVCENASHLRVGTGNIEFAALAAPRPYGMTGAKDWTIEILTKGLPELKALWRAYGKQDLVEAWCHPEFDHNYNQVSREHMYEWFNRHLGLGHSSPVEEKPFVPVPPAELSVFDEQHKLPEGAVDAQKLRAWLTETSDAQIAALVPKDPAGFEEFRRVIGGALAAILHTSLPRPEEVEAKDYEASEAGGARVRRLTLGRKGSGEAVPALLLSPKEPRDWNGVVTVVVDPRGKRRAFSGGTGPDLDDEVEGLLARGAAILAIDVFLTGEYLAAEPAGTDGDGGGGERPPAGPSSPLFGKDGSRHGKFVGYTYGYNRTLIAQRVHDVLTAIAFARSLEGARKVNLVGARRAAPWALLARALAGDAVSRTVVSFGASGSRLDFKSMKSFDDADFLPGALKYGGMPYFTALCAPAELYLVEGPPPEEVVRAAYRAAGRPEALNHFAKPTNQVDQDALLERLAK